MGSQLQRALRFLCSNTGWKYAGFWKLKQQARMMLTWEDAYYESDDNPEKKCPSNFVSNLPDGHCLLDPLGVALAKMSYHAYSLGEGIVGQVAITDKHLWISADKHVIDPGSIHEYYDGWQAQFSAGIKTIAFVSVVPYGVIQLGSLDKITEDLKMVNHIRNVFLGLQGSLAGHPPFAMPSRIGSSCQSNITTTTSSSGVHQGLILDRTVDKDGMKYWSSLYSSNENPGHYACNLSIPGTYEHKMVQMINKHEGLESSIPELGRSDDLHESNSGSVSAKQLNHTQLRAIGDTKCDGQRSSFGCLAESSQDRVALCTNNFSSKNSSYSVALSTEDSVMEEMSYLPSEILDSKAWNNERDLPCVAELPDAHLAKDRPNIMHLPFRFCAGYELYEALGPAFQKQDSHYEWDAEKTESGLALEMSEGIENSSLLTENSGMEHLLDAVVANIHKNEGRKSEKPWLKSELHLNPEKTSESCISDKGSLSSAGYSFQDSLNSFNSSLASGVCYSKGFSSTSCSRSSKSMERSQESNKIQKKRARPGESCRPRPRDRQLIQDRIKELRELVPNGSKCSIDSLLERTIKHMIFMQSITKHAEMLNKCTKSKLLDKEPSIQGSSCQEHGSSWAVELGSNLKVCPIIVENLDMNGQMLIEMLCDECSHFFDITEAIHNMGLTLLKGVTEICGEKIWMRFVVEVQNNRSLHRMEVLWSLMQLLQPKIKI